MHFKYIFIGIHIFRKDGTVRNKIANFWVINSLYGTCGSTAMSEIATKKNTTHFVRTFNNQLFDLVTEKGTNKFTIYLK